jgi:hypothetical protein
MTEIKKLTNDDRMDIAIAINDKLVKMGYVPDNTDTDNQDEFNVMDMINAILKKQKLYKESKSKFVVVKK